MQMYPITDSDLRSVRFQPIITESPLDWSINESSIHRVILITSNILLLRVLLLLLLLLSINFIPIQCLIKHGSQEV